MNEEQYFGGGYTPQYDGSGLAIAAALTPTPSMSYEHKQRMRQQNALMMYQLAQQQQQQQQLEQRKVADIAAQLEKVRQTPMPMVNKKAYLDNQVQPLLNSFQETLAKKYQGNLTKYLNNEGYAIPLKLQRLTGTPEYLTGVNNQEAVKAAKEAYLKGEVPKGEFSDAYNKLLAGDATTVLEWRGGYKPQDLAGYVSKKEHPSVVGGMTYEVGKGWKSAPPLSPEEKQREIRALYSDSTLSEKDLEGIYKQYEDVPMFYKRSTTDALSGEKFKADIIKDERSYGLDAARLAETKKNNAFGRYARERALDQADTRIAQSESSAKSDAAIQSPYTRFFTPQNNEQTMKLPSPAKVMSGGKLKNATGVRRVDISGTRPAYFDDFINTKTGISPVYETTDTGEPVRDPLTRKPKVKEYRLQPGGVFYGADGQKYDVKAPNGKSTVLHNFNPNEIYQFYDDNDNLLSYGMYAEVYRPNGTPVKGFVRIDDVSPEAMQGLNMQSNIGAKNKLSNSADLGATLPMDVEQ